MGYDDVGKELLEHAKAEGLTVRGALQDLFPYIYAVSERMSTRKISEWLEEKHGITVSFSSVAKALQSAEGYITETASKFYGDAAALDYYIPHSMEFSGLDVLSSYSLFLALKLDAPPLDNFGIVKSILENLDKTWFELPDSYRDACMQEMRKWKKQERRKRDEEVHEG
jgi:hypothetical protein